MAKLILIAGLPGSGKSRYGGKLKSKVGATCYVDDYHAQANDNRPGFENGREYRNLIAGLKRGEVWVASDIEWCRAEKRREVEAALHKAVPHVHIEWHFLAAGEDKCRERVRQRGRKSVDDELSKIDELLHEYHVPLGAKIVDNDDGFGEQMDGEGLGSTGTSRNPLS